MKESCEYTLYGDLDGMTVTELRANYQYSWHEELITRDEFETRMGQSTCAWPQKMLHDIMERYKND